MILQIVNHQKWLPLLGHLAEEVPHFGWKDFQKKRRKEFQLQEGLFNYFSFSFLNFSVDHLLLIQSEDRPRPRPIIRRPELDYSRPQETG